LSGDPEPFLLDEINQRHHVSQRIPGTNHAMHDDVAVQ
jgi:hypothetical protein